MKLSELAHGSQELLREDGFLSIKPHTFGRIRSSILQIVTFQGQKNDIYVWANSLPLALPDLHPSAGWKNAARRWPAAEGEVTCRDPSELRQVAKHLAALCRHEVLPYCGELSALDRLSDAFSEDITLSAALPKAFCHFHQGDYLGGRQCLERFLLDPIDRLAKRDARRYISYSDKELADALQAEVRANVKKHKLAPLMVANNSSKPTPLRGAA